MALTQQAKSTMYLALSKYNELAEMPKVVSISLRVMLGLTFFKCIGALYIYSIKQGYNVLRQMLIKKDFGWAEKGSIVICETTCTIYVSVLSSCTCLLWTSFMKLPINHL